MKSYALYTTFNDSCLEIGSNMIFSFLYNNKWFDGDIIILCDHGEYAGLSAESRQQLNQLYDKIIFKDDCYDIYRDVVEHCKELSYTPATLLCYYKLELIKKDEYEVKVYLDADVIVDNNIKELFVNKNNIRNAAAIDFGVADCAQFNFNKALSIYKKQDDDYFNAGVMIVKNDYITSDLYDKCINFCINCKENNYNNKFTYKGKLVDQDMFNELLPNVDILTYNYNIFAMTFVSLYNNLDETNDYNILNIIKNIKIIHYCGLPFKPSNIELNNQYIPYNKLKVFDIYYRYDYLRKVSKQIKLKTTTNLKDLIYNQNYNMNTNIYIYTHKDFIPYVSNNAYKILTCNQLHNKYNFETYNTHTGNNLSRIDFGYCEISGLYWIWKNITNLSDFIGLVHYRTYFNFLDNIPNIKTNEIILPFPQNVTLYGHKNLKEHYQHYHNINDWELCEHIIKEKYPEYIDALEKTINSELVYFRNCFIMSKENYIKYMTWLFDILFAFDKIRGFNTIEDITKYVNEHYDEYKHDNETIEYQTRIQGFLAERLFNVFINHNFKLSDIKHYDYIITAQNNRWKEN